MRKIWAVILGLLLMGANQLPSLGFNRAQAESSDAGLKADELVLVGTVTKIYPLSTPRRRRAWAIVTRVDSVVSGEFSGGTFTFTVHSPSRAGLQVNRAYVIKATRTGDGYVVNELSLKLSGPDLQSK
ncbi:MAG TPA: hypothetical protein VJT09_08125 [Pyrinomonadaceae bacterium]|nr:hypothetical protein [Pyrinomonadaceae bacterium]